MSPVREDWKHGSPMERNLGVKETPTLSNEEGLSYSLNTRVFFLERGCKFY